MQLTWLVELDTTHGNNTEYGLTGAWATQIKSVVIGCMGVWAGLLYSMRLNFLHLCISLFSILDTAYCNMGEHVDGMHWIV